tara:strand:+ start:951 stop:1118 length:168 start_codon:yes stop_codon:yes gene_type:complete
LRGFISIDDIKGNLFSPIKGFPAVKASNIELILLFKSGVMAIENLVATELVYLCV